MNKAHWYSYIGNKKIAVIELRDQNNERVWIKFEPVDKSKPEEVGNILDKPKKVSWKYKNSHFETIDRQGKKNYYGADEAGSISVASGKTEICKNAGSKVILFPLNRGVSLDTYGYSHSGTRFEIQVNKPTWVGYLVKGSGSISPV